MVSSSLDKLDGNKQIIFDGVLGTESTKKEVFEQIRLYIISALYGRKVTLFAYASKEIGKNYIM